MKRGTYTFRQWCQDNGERGQRLWKECIGVDANGVAIDKDNIAWMSNKYLKWECSICHNIWNKDVAHRTGYGSNCPTCSKKAAGNQQRSKFRVSFLEYCSSQGADGEILLQEFGEGLDEYGKYNKPFEVGKCSTVKFKWRCQKCGNEWWDNIADRTRKNRGTKCSECARREREKQRGKKRIIQYLDKWCDENGEFGARLRAEYTGYSEDGKGPYPIEKVPRATGMKMLWRCQECGETFPAYVFARTRNQSVHKECQKARVRKERAANGDSLYDWCIRNNKMDLLEEFTGFCENDKKTYSPRKITYGNGKKFRWVCKKCGNVWASTVNNRTSHGKGCKICANLKNGSLGEYCTKAGTRGKQLEAEYIGDTRDGKHYDIDKIGAGSSTRVSWKCSRGHIFFARVGHRVSNGNDCGICLCEDTPRDSFPERFIRYSMEQVFQHVDHNKRVSIEYVKRVLKLGETDIRIQGHSSMEFDLIIQEGNIRVYIEYNGEYYHRLTEDWDELKRELIKAKGYDFIQIVGCMNGSETKDCMESGQINYHPATAYHKDEHIEQLKKIVEYIAGLYGHANPNIDYDKVRELAEKKDRETD